MEKMVTDGDAFSGCYAGKRVLITGNTGFKGSWLSLWLIHLGADVYGLSNGIPGEEQASDACSLYRQLGLEQRLHQYWVDVRDSAAVQRVVEEVRPDFVFHLAAQALVSVSYRNPSETFEINVMGMVHVLDALRTLKHTCTAILITSDKCYDNVEWVWGYKETDPMGGKDPYSGSKGAAELVFKSYFHSYFKSGDVPVRVATARAGNVIGGGDWALDRIVPDCIRSWSKGQTVEIRSPQATRPWQHVLEPLSGYLALGQQLSERKELNGQSFNFGPAAENTHTVVELLSDIGSVFGMPDGMAPYTITGNVPFHEAGLLKLNCDKALFELKWKPVLNYTELTELTAGWYAVWHQKQADLYAFTQQQLEVYQSKARERAAVWTQK